MNTNKENTSGGRPKKQILIGKVFADWCGHCVSLKPEWEKMKRFIKMNMGRKLKNVRVEFVEIGDTEKNKAAGKTVEGMIAEFNQKHNSDLKSEGFPTIFKHCDGKLEYYTGERTAKPLYKWYMSSCEPSSIGGNDETNIQSGGRAKTRRKKSIKSTSRLGFSFFGFGKKSKSKTKKGWFM